MVGEFKKILLVVDRQPHASYLRKILDPELFVVTSIGSAIAGQRFAHVVVCTPVTPENHSYIDNLKTKIPPGTNILYTTTGY